MTGLTTRAVWGYQTDFRLNRMRDVLVRWSFVNDSLVKRPDTLRLGPQRRRERNRQTERKKETSDGINQHLESRNQQRRGASVWRHCYSVIFSSKTLEFLTQRNDYLLGLKNSSFCHCTKKILLVSISIFRLLWKWLFFGTNHSNFGFFWLLVSKIGLFAT